MEIIRTKDVTINDNITFDSLFLSKSVLQGLKEKQFLKPSPIQLKAIPLGKCGFDLIIKSKSGTGKTAVFAIIALEMIDTSKNVVQVVVLGPTREIAVQSCEVISSIGRYITGLKVEHFIGGLPLPEDKIKAMNCQIVVGSPGRLLHLIELGVIKMKHVKLFVLDEADNLMERNYQADINQIYHSMPKCKQMLAVSATYPDDLDSFLANYMQMPSVVSTDMSIPLLLGLKHFVTITNCNANVLHMTKIKNNELVRLLTHISFTQCLIFCNYQTRAEEISTYLNTTGWKSNFISAAQTQKQRLESLQQLKNFECRILLSTDLTARGIDAVNVNLVINYDIPRDASTYLHRMGRAGRYGTKGLCISIAAKGKDLANFSQIIGEIGGADMSVPILPMDQVLNNIWDADQTNFEILKGSEKSANDANHLEIMNSIKTLRTEGRNCEDYNIAEVKPSRKQSDTEIESHEEGFKSEQNVDESQLFLIKLASGQAETLNAPPLRDAEQTFTKNVSLMSVSRLLQNDDINVNHDDPVLTETIENFVKSLKSTDVNVTQYSKQISASSDKNEEDMVEKEEDIENIFVVAYDHAVDNRKPHWIDVFKIQDDDETENADEGGANILQDLLDYAANDSEPEYDNYNIDEQCYDDSEIANDSSIKANETSLNCIPESNSELMLEAKSPKTHSMQIPSLSRRGEFEELFTSSTNNFQIKFNSLENVGEFQNSWNDWQTQMTSIREYIQQNIYIDEMNAFKLNKYK